MHRPILMAASAAALCGIALAGVAAAEIGPTIFAGACAACHAAGSPRVVAGQPLLGKTRAIMGDTPARAINLVLDGHFPPPEQRGAWMPSFAGMLDDAEIAGVLNWLRQEAGQPPWPDLAARVQVARANGAEARR
ncbi:MAG TPA: c-type cytochrome [Acetobacteraceae bacterium]|nr:c-type cytochrome [Acetobacteraceae bacterium]